MSALTDLAPLPLEPAPLPARRDREDAAVPAPPARWAGR